MGNAGLDMINLTLKDDQSFERAATPSGGEGAFGFGRGDVSSRFSGGYYERGEQFEVVLTVDPEQLKAADHGDVKLRNLPTSYQLSGEDPEAGVIASPSTKQDDTVVGGVNDLIGLTHLHEPAILHALRLRYDADIIYTATGPILIAVNPFKPMGLYSDEMMEKYRAQGENQGIGSSAMAAAASARGRGSGEGGGGQGFVTPFRRRDKAKMRTEDESRRLPPHAYQTADDAYRAMMRGVENARLMSTVRRARDLPRGKSMLQVLSHESPTNQSILVSGESGAGKTVTTKIVLNYFAMLSKWRSGVGANPSSPRSSGNFGSSQMFSSNLFGAGSPMSSSSSSRHPGSPATAPGTAATAVMMAAASSPDDVSIEQQVLQSNPILESFGNARTIRNDNSSRFGKFIDIRFTPDGKLSGASIETYLLEKVRLIHPSGGERNYHVFYQFLSSATGTERDNFLLGNMGMKDFRLLSQTGTYDRRDGVSDPVNHQEMLEAMVSRKLYALFFIIDMTFHIEYCVNFVLWNNPSSLSLLLSPSDHHRLRPRDHPISHAIGRCCPPCGQYVLHPRSPGRVLPVGRQLRVPCRCVSPGRHL